MEDNIIYHYTDIAGLMGIFSKCNSDNPKIIMRASCSDYMNDPTERIHSISVLSHLIEAIEKMEGKTPKISRLLEKISQHRYDKQVRYINQYIDSRNHYMIASFSKSRDCLPMWGRYAGNGRGIAIGFDVDKLKKSASAETYYLELDYTNGTKCQSWLFDQIHNTYKELISKHDESEVIHKLIGAYSMWFKNKAYEYENEVRLMQIHNKFAENIKSRELNGLIVPYVDIEIDINCISSYIVGPSGRMIDKWQSVRDFLSTKKAIHGSDRELIVESEIPYRNNA